MFFSATMVLQFVVALVMCPETKGVSLEEMRKRLTAA
jgi:hypothetical protein